MGSRVFRGTSLHVVAWVSGEGHVLSRPGVPRAASRGPEALAAGTRGGGLRPQLAERSQSPWLGPREWVRNGCQMHPSTVTPAPCALDLPRSRPTLGPASLPAGSALFVNNK